MVNLSIVVCFYQFPIKILFYNRYINIEAFVHEKTIHSTGPEPDTKRPGQTGICLFPATALQAMDPVIVHFSDKHPVGPNQKCMNVNQTLDKSPSNGTIFLNKISF